MKVSALERPGGRRRPRGIQVGSRKWKLLIMRQWAGEISAGLPRHMRRRPPRGVNREYVEGFWWLDRREPYSGGPR